MVVAHFHPNASGAEGQALLQGKELARRGHHVRVVTHAVAGWPRDESFHGIQIHRWVEPVRLGPLFGLSYVWSTARALRQLRGQFDVVHTHQALWEAIAVGYARARGWLGGAPSLIQPASSGFYGEAESLRRLKGHRLLLRLILRNTMFAAISADIESQWRTLGVPEGRMVRTASGVETDRFRPGPSEVESRLPPRPRALFTGRLHPQKNLDILLDAWPKVVEHTAAHLILLGQGEDRDRLRARAAALGIANNVHFPGSTDDPAPWLRGADLFVLPSVAEGMSNSLLEAMATGLPCIVSAIGGNVDLIAHGRDGWLAASNDSEAWSESITTLLRQPELARRLAEAARAKIERDFALPVVVDRYVALYRRLMAERIGASDQ